MLKMRSRNEPCPVGDRYEANVLARHDCFRCPFSWSFGNSLGSDGCFWHYGLGVVQQSSIWHPVSPELIDNSRGPLCGDSYGLFITDSLA